MANDITEKFEPGKLFVGGLSWETKEDSLRKYFSQFGEISDVVVVVKNNQHQGFGFVTFANPDVAESVLYSNSPGGHVIDGKKVDPKRATKNGQPQKVKVFLGGIPSTASTDDIRTAFSKFGPISVNGVELKHERGTDKRRGFAFVTYESEESATAAVMEHFVTVLGKPVEVKIAEHNKKAKGGGGGFNQGFGTQNAAVYSNYQQYQQPQAHAAAYGYGTGHSSGYPSYPQWQGYGDQYQGASSYYQGSSGAGNYSSGYGNSYNTPRTDSTGASYSAPQAQGYSYPQQQQQQQSYASYQGYSGGGGASRSQMQQQGYNGSFPPR